MIDERDACLFLLEITIGLKVTEHRRHVVGSIFQTIHLTRIGLEIAHFTALITHHKHSEHLAFSKTGQPLLQLTNGHEAQLVWLIIKGIIKLQRWLNMGMKRMKQHFLNAIVWCGKGNEKGADNQKRKGGKAIKARLPSVVYEIR